jgi:aerobic-type carbon monoxide dehydrogenase small subunit (CoxS/CutS family)
MMSRLILVLLIYGSTEANIMDVTVTLTVNGIERTITTHPARPLLDVLREELHLTGAKYGCGEGRCGACTVLLDGRRTLSCITPVSMADKKKVTTIEGLADGDSLHPVQQAFLDEGAIQCGYCTPGMIMSTVALLKNSPQPTDEQIVEWMNGNICRCNGYTKILKAVRSAAAQTAEVKIP